MKSKKMTTLSIRNSLHRSHRRRGFLRIPLAFTAACLALSQLTHAQCPQNCTGFGNTALGSGALLNNTGAGNTAIGSNALFTNTDGGDNTATGAFALSDNTTGDSNTANGSQALNSNTIGSENTATGEFALGFNTTGSFNTATGFKALLGTVGEATGSFNTANGHQALSANTTGDSNTANGFDALFNNTTGSFNAANGANALALNTTGGFNVANGGFALFSNTTGINNVAEGFDALFNNTTGSSNIAIGPGAGVNLTTGSNNIDIGNEGVAGESGVIRIGNSDRVSGQTATFIAGIRETPLAVGVAVGITPDGQLGVKASSARFKEAIKPMDRASEAILSLKPVTFRYKKTVDSKGTPQFGLVAEDVAKVAPDLVARDADGKPFTVRYDEVNAMLLNEFIKEHQKVQRLEAALAAVNERLKAQDAKIDKVNAKVELTKPAPQMVANDQ
jgi:hypothetical protein